MKEKPDYITDEHLEYLDELRESGDCNMFSATPYLIEEFGVSKNEGRDILSYWMKTYVERN
jgi:hypothetical protein